MLVGCSNLLQAIYPSETKNAVVFNITTSDSSITSSNASTMKVYVTLYAVGTHPLNQGSGLTYQAASSSYTGSVTFGGLPDGTYSAQAWLDLQGSGNFVYSDPEFQVQPFNLYGVQTLTLPVTVP